ncbi:MAG: M13-type metalloendopeptidase [Prevotella sp.]
MKKNLKLWMLLGAVTLGLASCTDNIDNPVTPEPENPETPEQQAFWAPFDAWQTDSCTVGDDFFMHTIGTWWKNPVDIYPGGLLNYASYLNDQRVKQIYASNPNLQLLQAHADEDLSMSEEELELMVNAKVEELWAGATTREEALAALGRAWAEGYTLKYEPIVNLVNGVPTWQMSEKIPSYLSDMQIFDNKEEMWRRLAQRKSVSMKARRAPNAVSDLSVIVKAMNIGADYLEINEEIAEQLLDDLENGLGTVEGIRAEIEQAVYLLDGALVNDEITASYNEYLTELFESEGTSREFHLTRSDIANYVMTYMANIYALNDYNRLYITQQMRQQYAGWCELFRDAMRQRLEANTWLEDDTRQNAIDKLNNIVFYVGGISVIPECVMPALSGDNLLEDVRQLRQARMDGYRWAATQTRSTCAMLLSNLLYISNATIDNASYDPSSNIVNINPSNLLPPYVEDNYEDALQWAFIGTTIGHELTHGFDSSGSQFDQWGNQINWWTEADADKFEELCDQLTDQYSSLQLMPWADPTLLGDGEKTLPENIADLGGCCLALQILLNQHPHASADQLKALARRYFQAWAIQWSNTYSLEFLKQMKVYDVHSQSRERTNGVVRNVDEWYDAYGITSGTLYLQPSERVYIW